MPVRRLLLLASVAAILLSTATLLGASVWSGARDRPAPNRPTGPATDAAERARADLASRLGTNPDEIAVDSVEEHTWNDASLGLPEPDMMYAQVITPGHIVTLRFAGRAYVYHVAGQTVKLAGDAR